MSIKNRLYQRITWDFSQIVRMDDRKLLQTALDACDYPFIRIRRKTGKRVPVTIADLARFNAALADGPHAHVSRTASSGEQQTGHLLGTPVPRAHADAEGAAPAFRSAALGLYWLPTRDQPAGEVQLDADVMDNPALAREVFLAEAAHAVDYGAFTEQDRAFIYNRFHDTPGTQGHAHDWFEEGGQEDYWSWAGERWMGLFMAAFAPDLRRPLEAQQPWTHQYDAADVVAVREYLLAKKK